MPNPLVRRRLSGRSNEAPILSGLQVVLRADLGTFTDSAFTTAAAVDGDAIGGWRDQSGNLFDFTSSGANRPTLKVGIVGGRPVVRFDGVDDRLLAVAGALGMAQNVGGFTVCGVFASAATASELVVVFITKDTANSTRILMGRTTASAFALRGRRLDADTSQVISGGAFTANAFTADFGIINYSGATAKLWSNGVQQASSGSFQTAGSTSNTASHAITLGADETGSYLGLDIAELRMYNRDLLDGERGLLDQYFKTRYSLSY